MRLHEPKEAFADSDLNLDLCSCRQALSYKLYFPVGQMPPPHVKQ